MTFEFAKNADLLVVVGSQLYGCARYNEAGECVSDLDLRGFVTPPLDYLVEWDHFDEQSLDGDHIVFSLKKYFNLLIKGNTQCLESLFAPAKYVVTCTEVGKLVRGNRHLFAAKHYYNSITGFSYSEWNKVRGVKQVPVNRNNQERNAIDMFRNAFKHLPKDKWDSMLETAYSEHERVMVDSKAEVGEKRRAEYDKYGYCASCAHHALRLLYQCEELLRDGFITFPRPEAALLSSVKRGEPSLEEVQRLYEEIRPRVDKAAEQSKLPERADTKKIKELYLQIVRDKLKIELNE